MKVIQTEDYYAIIFDNLLPKRAWTKKEYDTISQKLIVPLYSELKKAKLPVIRKRAAIEIIHHYKSEEELKDFDNIESKLVIDCITAQLLADDSPKYLSAHFDYCIDSSNYTEIRVWEEEKYFLNKAKQPSK